MAARNRAADCMAGRKEIEESLLAERERRDWFGCLERFGLGRFGRGVLEPKNLRAAGMTKRRGLPD